MAMVEYICATYKCAFTTESYPAASLALVVLWLRATAIVVTAGGSWRAAACAGLSVR